MSLWWLAMRYGMRLGNQHLYIFGLGCQNLSIYSKSTHAQPSPVKVTSSKSFSPPTEAEVPASVATGNASGIVATVPLSKPETGESIQLHGFSQTLQSLCFGQLSGSTSCIKSVHVKMYSSSVIYKLQLFYIAILYVLTINKSFCINYIQYKVLQDKHYSEC